MTRPASFQPTDRPFGGPHTFQECVDHLEGHGTLPHGHTPEASRQIGQVQQWLHEEKARQANTAGALRRQRVEDAKAALAASAPRLEVVKTLYRGGKCYAVVEVSEAEGATCETYRLLFRRKGTTGWTGSGNPIPAAALPNRATIVVPGGPGTVIFGAQGHASVGDTPVTEVWSTFAEQPKPTGESEADRKRRQDKERADALEARHKRLRDEAQARADERAKIAEREAAARREKDKERQANIRLGERMRAKIAATPPTLTAEVVSSRSKVKRRIKLTLQRHPDSPCDRYQLLRRRHDGSWSASGRSWGRGRLEKPFVLYRWAYRRGTTTFALRAGSKWGSIESPEVTI